MLIKHTLIFGMLLIGFWFNAILRVGPNAVTGKPENWRRLRLYATLMWVAGALVLLLTAAGQTY